MKIDKFKGRNIFWLASYPKSGNTMLRLFLSLYFFTKDGILKNFNVINNINSMNNYKIYKKLKDFPPIDNFILNPEMISNYWLRAQKNITKLYPKKIFFLKHIMLILNLTLLILQTSLLQEDLFI